MNPTLANSTKRYRNRFALQFLFFKMVITAAAVPPTIISSSGNPDMAVLSIKFSQPVTEITATDVFNYSVNDPHNISHITMDDTSMSNGVVLARTVFLVMDGPLPENSLITVTVNGVQNLAGDYIAGNTTVQCRTFKFSPGLILFESYYPIVGTAVTALTSHPDFPIRSREQLYMPSFDTRTVYPDDTHDNYGARISGLFVPKASGNYIFFLRSDASSQLFLNPNGSDPDGAGMIAEEPGCCHEFSDIASALYALVAGQRYFIMALYKEGAGADYCQVAVKLDSDPTNPNALYPISGGDLGAWADPTGAILTITQQPTNQFFTPAGIANPGDPTNVTFSVSAIASRPDVTNQTIFYQWQRNGGSGFNDIPGANGQNYTLSPVVADNNAQFRVLLAIPGNNATSLAASLKTNILYGLTLATNGSGTVSRSPDQPLYAANSTVMLTATPSPGWGFSGWSSDASGTNNPLSVTMTTNKSITANFTNLSGCVPAPPGLVSWWPGAGNANDIIGNNNGALQNGATNAVGKVGQGFNFDGGNDYVNVADSPTLDPGTGSFTIEGWVRTTRTGASQIIASKYECGGNCPPGADSFCEVGLLSSGVLYGNLRDTTGGFQGHGGTRNLSDGTFHHVAMLRDIGTSRFRLYVDGTIERDEVLVATGTIKNDDGEADPLIIGAHYEAGTTTLRDFFQGNIDELSYYNRALTQNDITAINNAASIGKCPPVCTPAPSGLVSWWPGADNANDIFGNNNGTLQNGATNAAGKVGQGFSFDGVNDNVSFPDSGTLSITGALSIEAWIKPNLAPNGAIVSKYDSTLVNGASYLLAYYPSFGLRFIVFASDTNYRAAATVTNAISPNAFAHVAATFSPAGQVMKLYVNGVEIPVTIEPGAGNVSAIMDNQAPVRLGALVNGSGQLDYRYSGLIDEVGLYNRQLSATEIQVIYASGSSGKCLTPLYITSVNKSGNNLNLSWLAQAGLLYRVQYKTNLNAATPWTDDVSGDVTATNTTASKTVIVPADAPQRFYRVELFR